MNEVHIALQGKGGIGKSLVCRMLGEFRGAICIDADPENRSLAACKGLQVQEFDLLDARKSIDPFAIDKLMEMVLEETEDVVIDIGASSFVEVSAYFVENDLENVFKEARKDLWLHLVVVGGPSQGACLRTVVERIRRKHEQGNAKAETCVWENEYFGGLMYDTSSGKRVRDVVDQAGFKHVLLPERGVLFVRAFEAMIRDGLTFDEAINDAATLLGRARLERQRNELWTQLEEVFAKDESATAGSQAVVA